MTYEIINRHTGKRHVYQTLARARHAADRMDNEYGAICCSVRRVEDAPKTAPIPATEYHCGPARIVTEHEAELYSIFSAAMAGAR